MGNVQFVDVYNMASVWNKFRNEYLQCRMFLFHYFFFFRVSNEDWRIKNVICICYKTILFFYFFCFLAFTCTCHRFTMFFFGNHDVMLVVERASSALLSNLCFKFLPSFFFLLMNVMSITFLQYFYNKS